MDMGGIGIAVGVVLAIVGFFVGRASGRSGGMGAGRTEGLDAGRQEARAEAEQQMRGVVDDVARGRLPKGGPPGSIEAELANALKTGWTSRDAERQQALGEALGRVAGYLDQAVRQPLTGVSDDTVAGELRERIERALGSLQDMEFFLREPGQDTEGRDVAALVQQTTREFAQDQGVSVRVSLGAATVRAEVNGPALMDALYLVLHNAGRFGGGAIVDVTVVSEDGRAVVKVRDRGQGFTEEAFKRAFDPFYSSTSDGLGLGLPHARKVVEGMGGKIELRNVPDGGAEVELSFPSA